MARKWLWEVNAVKTAVGSSKQSAEECLRGGLLLAAQHDTCFMLRCCAVHAVGACLSTSLDARYMFHAHLSTAVCGAVRLVLGMTTCARQLCMCVMCT
jgi:hypothetical protein